MNKAIKFMAALMCVAMPVVMSSCSDDDDNDDVVVPDVNRVLVPKQIGDNEFTTNAAGKVTKIDNGNNVIEFEYGTFSRTTTYQVKMTKYNKEYPDYKTDYYFQLNNKGYAEHALKVDSDGDEETWDFGYNSDGQLNYLTYSEFSNSATEITYVNGDITRVKYGRATSNISYTNSEITTAIDNVAGIMLFFEVFDINWMHEITMVYYTGMFGKATKHLPLRLYVEDPKMGVLSNALYKWTLNTDNYPTVLEKTFTNTWSTTKDTFNFKW